MDDKRKYNEIGAQTGGGGSGGATAMSLALMLSSMVDGRSGDATVSAALTSRIVPIGAFGLMVSFSYSSPPSSDSESKDNVECSKVLLLEPVPGYLLRGGSRGQSLHCSWPHAEQVDSPRKNVLWHSWQV